MHQQEQRSTAIDSRATANTFVQKKNVKEGFGFVDNRKDILGQFNQESQQQFKQYKSLGGEKGEGENTTVQRALVLNDKSGSSAAITNLWKARENEGIDSVGNKSKMTKNVADTNDWTAASAASGHAEQRSILKYFAATLKPVITVNTERKPCDSCDSDLKILSQITGKDVNANYLVDYSDDDNFTQELTELYVNNHNDDKTPWYDK